MPKGLPNRIWHVQAMQGGWYHSRDTRKFLQWLYNTVVNSIDCRRFTDRSKCQNICHMVCAAAVLPTTHGLPRRCGPAVQVNLKRVFRMHVCLYKYLTNCWPAVNDKGPRHEHYMQMALRPGQNILEQGDNLVHHNMDGSDAVTETKSKPLMPGNWYRYRQKQRSKVDHCCLAPRANQWSSPDTHAACMIMSHETDARPMPSVSFVS